MTTGKAPQAAALEIIPKDYKGPPILGIHPITGLPVEFIPFEPIPYKSKILFILGDNWYYSTDAGQTWEHNPQSLDMRQVDVVVSK